MTVWNHGSAPEETQCKRGHSLTPDNVYSYIKNGKPERQCKPCRKMMSNAYYAKHQEAKAKNVAEYRKTDRGRATRYKATLTQIKKNPLKTRARIALRNAVDTGRLTKPVACPKCGQEKRIEAHHTDYSKPLDVMWLCSYCHKAEHGTLIWQKK